MDKLGLKAFWFIYTKILSKNYDFNEIASYLVENVYKNFDDFYQIFLTYNKDIVKNLQTKEFEKFHEDLKNIFPGYSKFEIEYRYIRNKLLNHLEFNEIISDITKKNNIDLNYLVKKIWLTKDDIIHLSKEGHEIGLHSHNHPYELKNLDYDRQLFEYETNMKILYSITGVQIKSMSHPLNSYNLDTMKILAKLNILCGFRSNLSSQDLLEDTKFNNLQIGRHDSSMLKMLVQRYSEK